MPSLGPTELIVILVIVVILFGVGKLADVGGALGKSLRDFRHSFKDEQPIDPPRDTPGAS